MRRRERRSSPPAAPRQVDALEQHAARVGPLEERQAARERRLARAALADDADRLAALDGERGIGQRRPRVPGAGGRARATPGGARRSSSGARPPAASSARHRARRHATAAQRASSWSRRMQRAQCPRRGLRPSGSAAAAQTSRASWQRGANAQPGGGAPGRAACRGSARSRSPTHGLGEAVHQPDGVGVLRAAEHGPRRPISTSSPAYITADAVAEAGHDPEVVGDEQHAHALLAPERVQQAEDLGLHDDVERRGRLVGQQQASAARRAPWRSGSAGASRPRTRAGRPPRAGRRRECPPLHHLDRARPRGAQSEPRVRLDRPGRSRRRRAARD